MVDHTKRKTLKILSGAGAASMYSLTALAGTTEDIAHNNFIRRTDSGATADSIKAGSFTIQIISGKTAIEDTVIFNNQSGADIQITKFLPGMITQNNQMIDLNSLLTNTEITLKNGYPLATKAARWELLALDANHSYLWCDSAVSRLPNSDTGIITLDAVVNNGRALLTAKHDELLLS